MNGEHSIIHRYFRRRPPEIQDGFVCLGVGDDAAVVKGSGWMCLAKDLLVEGVHFYPDDPPESLGHRIAAVNLSDCAAMGAVPRYALLGLALPERLGHDAWLSAFCGGLFALLDDHQVALVGGDTVQAEQLVLSMTLVGHIAGRADRLRRTSAQIGDDVWVSGVIGLAGLALAGRVDEVCIQKRLYPEPRLHLGRMLGDLQGVHAMIDISDGLLADVQHLANQSKCNIELSLSSIPCLADLNEHDRWLSYTCGDDYELCFTASPRCRQDILSIAGTCDLSLTRIGVCRSGCGHLYTDDGVLLSSDHARLGYEHL